MRAPHKILVPIDFSERSLEGIRYAALLARPVGASLVLMSSIGGIEPAEDDPGASQARIELGINARQELERLAQTLAPDIDSTMVADFHDDVAAGILAVADAEHADLIVIASHGRSKLKKFVLGSVAQDVIARAHLPVTVVPVWQTDAEPMR